MHTTIDQEMLRVMLTTTKTPFYLYNKRVLKETIEEIKNAFPIQGFQLLFATMANDHEEFLKEIYLNKVGACVNSVNHLTKVLNSGIPVSQIQYTSTGLSPEDLHLLHQHNISVNIDSLNQLRSWLSIRKGSCAGIRINTSSLQSNGLAADRLGIHQADIPAALQIAGEEGGTLNGLHIYVGTNFQSPEKMLPVIRQFFQLAATIPELSYVNIGGGVGIHYTDSTSKFDLHLYGRSICELVLQLREKTGRNIQLIFEPGRYLAAPSGVFVTTVTDIKYLGPTRYVVVDASVAVFPRPLHHPDSLHQVISPFKTINEEPDNAVIVGKTTFSRDILTTQPLPRNLSVGDILVFDQAGAYCESMRSKFLGQQEPASIFIDA